ncbi:hypothetical protein GGF46_002306 [Coemansia sp. RSA 552]|nr:hypothetical protein GGF46_002306 [Coemansia sp. RSA 552]
MIFVELLLCSLSLLAAAGAHASQAAGLPLLPPPAAAHFANSPTPRIGVAPAPNATCETGACSTPPHPDPQDENGRRCHRAVRLQPYNCSYVRAQCAGYGDGVVNYVELYYCSDPSRRGAVLTGLALWIALLFIWLGVAASEYFSPNISTLAKLLRFPESLAGVTILALGNGAPDLSSTFGAVRAGSAAMAIGQIVGSASFIVGVVVCTITLAVPAFKVSRLPYLRELCFFIATVGLIAVVVLQERLSQGLAVCMVLLYALYVATVVATTYYEELVLRTGHLEGAGELSVDQYTRTNVQSISAEDSTNEHTHLLQSSIPVDPTAGIRGRRNTVGCIGTSVAQTDGDMWDLEPLIVGDLPSRALGGLLQQHRKSLLAAAECNDILEDIHRPSTHASPVSRAATGDSFALPLESSVGSEQGLPSNDPQALPATHRESAELLPPAPWDNYTMGSAAALQPAAMGEAPVNTVADTGGRVISPHHARLLADDRHTTQKANSTPGSIQQRSGILPPEHLDTLAVDVHGQRRLEPHLSLSQASSIANADAQTTKGTTRSSTRGTAPAGLFLSHTSASASAAILGSRSPALSLDSRSIVHGQAQTRCVAYSMSCKQLFGSEGSRLYAIVYACIPTLRHWLPGSTTSLKAFVAFSAFPVFLLTLTVPVVASLPGAEDDDDNCQWADAASSAGETADHPEAASARTDTGAQPLLHPPPGSSSLSVQSGAIHCGADWNAIRADFSWAEAAVSYMRSAISVSFLFYVLHLGGYLEPVPNGGARALVGCFVAVLSLLANYLSRACARWRPWARVVPCFLGFATGLVWVSVIADEIVSITQSLGLMLGLSEEILGLTIVGFGNSLGDLVTNLTLARMGFPMMALSACFGGPMLCLLLGVGVAACANMARAGPGGGSFEIPMTSPTVLVSAACLLINSLMFLVLIPCQGYYMTRGAGIAALLVYLVGMTVNIYLEQQQSRL